MKLNSTVIYPCEVYVGNGQFRKETREGTLVKTFSFSNGTTFAVILGSGPRRGIKTVVRFDTLLRYNKAACSSNLEDWL